MITKTTEIEVKSNQNYLTIKQKDDKVLLDSYNVLKIFKIWLVGSIIYYSKKLNKFLSELSKGCPRVTKY